METFAKAQKRILSELKDLGWTVQEHLKVPHATSSDGLRRLWFKTQAVWFTAGNNQHAFGEARSLHCEIRGVEAVRIIVRLSSWSDSVKVKTDQNPCVDTRILNR